MNINVQTNGGNVNIIGIQNISVVGQNFSLRDLNSSELASKDLHEAKANSVVKNDTEKYVSESAERIHTFAKETAPPGGAPF